MCWLKEARPKKVYTVLLHLYKILENANLPILRESRLMVTWEQGGTGQSYYEKAQRKIGEEVTDMFIILVVMVSWVYTYVNTYQIIHFKYMRFTVCQLYLKLLRKASTEFHIAAWSLHPKVVLLKWSRC